MKINNRPAFGYMLLIVDLFFVGIIFFLQRFNENFKETYSPNLVVWTSIPLLFVALYFMFVTKEEEEDGK
ncbi:hypothetical protein LCGC14_0534680 [marine sediment metagenome]|uniref:Uncharacterized protein n=1 Tax=marine sediment metagenome TaxID=412755 RepID=A0A0F9SCZ4_9ZZZZ